MNCMAEQYLMLSRSVRSVKVVYKQKMKNTSGGDYNQLDFKYVERLKFECYRTTAVLWKHSQCKMIWWTCLFHLLINNGFYIYSRTAGYRFQNRVKKFLRPSIKITFALWMTREWQRTKICFPVKWFQYCPWFQRDYVRQGCRTTSKHARYTYM